MNMMMAIICIAAGVISAIFPSSAWYVSYGWRYKDNDPSQAALVTQRVGGILLMLIGFIMLTASCSA